MLYTTLATMARQGLPMTDIDRERAKIRYIPGWYLRQDQTIPVHRADCICHICKKD